MDYKFKNAIRFYGIYWSQAILWPAERLLDDLRSGPLFAYPWKYPPVFLKTHEAQLRTWWNVNVFMDPLEYTANQIIMEVTFFNFFQARGLFWKFVR